MTTMNLLSDEFIITMRMWADLILAAIPLVSHSEWHPLASELGAMMHDVTQCRRDLEAEVCIPDISAEDYQHCDRLDRAAYDAYFRYAHIVSGKAANEMRRWGVLEGMTDGQVRYALINYYHPNVELIPDRIEVPGNL